MTWFAWKGYNGNKAVDIAGSQEKEAVSLGFHGYGTEKEAETKPNSVAGLPNPLAIPQKAFVNGIIADYKAAKAQGEQPGGPNSTLTPGNIVKGAAQGAASVAGNTVATAFGDVLSAIPWVRIIKVVAGGALLLLGLAKLTGADKTIAIAGKAVAKAPLL